MRKAVLVLVFIAIMANCGWCKQVEGITHAHDKNSDGLLSEKELIKSMPKAVQFLILTNHLFFLTGEHDECKDITNDYFSSTPFAYKNLIVLRCCEIDTNIPDAHILLYGIFGPSMITDDFKELNGKSAQVIIDFAHSNDLLAVMAHPHNGYDPRAIGYDGIEFFNTKTIANKDQIDNRFKLQETQNLKLYCRMIKDYLHNSGFGKLPAAYGGTDIHASQAELIFGRTVVYVPDGQLTAESLLQAMADRRTYAKLYGEIYGTSLVNINYPPQIDPYNVNNEVKIKGTLKIVHDPGIRIDTIDLYRDGNKIASKKINPLSIISEFEFVDKDVKNGKHIYFLYVPCHLITSPIVMDVDRQKEVVSPNQEFELLLEGPMHHLGDNKFDTPVNVGFVKQAEGFCWSKRFVLPDGCASRNDGYIVMNIRGAENSSVFLNEHLIGSLRNNLTDNGQAQAYLIPPGIAKDGENIVMVISHQTERGFFTTYYDNDDIEFNDLTIFFGNINPHVK